MCTGKQYRPSDRVPRKEAGRCTCLTPSFRPVTADFEDTGPVYICSRVCLCLCFILNSFWFSTIISVSSLACPVCLMVESAPAALGLRWTLKLFEDCLHTCPVSTVCSQTQHHWILTSVTQPPPSKMLLHHPESLCTFQITVSHQNGGLGEMSRV